MLKYSRPLNIMNPFAPEARMILFICFGNVHRSLLAEHSANEEFTKNCFNREYYAISRGIQGALGYQKPKHSSLPEYTEQWSLTQPILNDLGIDTSFFSLHKSTPVTLEDIEQAFVIIAMSSKEYRILLEYFSDHRQKIHLFSTLFDSQDIQDLAESVVEDDHYTVNSTIIHSIRGNAHHVLALAE